MRGAGRIVTEPCPACQGSSTHLIEERTIAATHPGRHRVRHAPSRSQTKGSTESTRGPPGDLYVAITVSRTRSSSARGTISSVTSRFILSQLHTQEERLEVPTLKGNTVIKIPAGTQHDKTLRIKGLGIPSLQEPDYRRPIICHQDSDSNQADRSSERIAQRICQRERHGRWKRTADGFFDKMKTFFE